MTPATVENSVIVAENDAVMRNIMRSVLSRAGQLVLPVANGCDTVRLARQIRARLVLLDIAMPQLNGLLTCRALRRLPGYGDVPIVMVTGLNDARVRKAAMHVGATAFVTKPFSPQQLLSLLAGFLDLPQALLAVGERREETPLPPGGIVNQATRVLWERTAAPLDAGPVHRDNPALASGKEVIDLYRRL